MTTLGAIVLIGILLVILVSGVIGYHLGYQRAVEYVTQFGYGVK